MKKNTTMLIGLIVIIILVVGGYATFHKSNKPTTNTANTSTSNKTSQAQPAAANNDVLKTKTNSIVGQYLTDTSGKTLYTYGGDSSGTSNVTGSLLASWPAYLDTGSTTGLPTNVSTLKRTDNAETQYTYKGMPLYTFVSDSPGQVTGDGIVNFHIAKP